VDERDVDGDVFGLVVLVTAFRALAWYQCCKTWFIRH
jgi:hypothetical protein